MVWDHDEENEREKFGEMAKACEEAHSRATGYFGQTTQRVDYMLRPEDADYQNYFQPRVVAFSPVHHGQPKYEWAEKFKLIMADNFIRESGQQRKDLLGKIGRELHVIYCSYHEEVTRAYDAQSLAWMLFIDGCSILDFIHGRRHARRKFSVPLFEEQDLFLLENQIPYRVLQLLMESSTNRVSLINSIIRFVQQQFSSSESPIDHNSFDHNSPHAHLLDILRKGLSGYNGTYIRAEENQFCSFAVL